MQETQPTKAKTETAVTKAVTKGDSKSDSKETGFQPQSRDFHIDKLLEYVHSMKNGNTTFATYDRFRVQAHEDLNTIQKVTIPFGAYDISVRYHMSVWSINCVKMVDDGVNIHQHYLTLMNGYSQYDQRFYIAGGRLISTVKRGGVTYFDTYQISDMLGYARSSYLASYYGTHCTLTMIREGGRVYVDKAGLREILSRGRKPGCRTLMEQLDLSTVTKIQSHEANVLEETIEFLGEEKIAYKLQYPVGSYRVDMYIPDYKVVVEVDEMGHADRDPASEQARELYIRTHLTDKILRINPNAPKFRMAKELARLNKLLK